jgi:hypothetical protein
MLSSVPALPGDLLEPLGLDPRNYLFVSLFGDLLQFANLVRSSRFAATSSFSCLRIASRALTLFF